MEGRQRRLPIEPVHPAGVAVDAVEDVDAALNVIERGCEIGHGGDSLPYIYYSIQVLPGRFKPVLSSPVAWPSYKPIHCLNSESESAMTLQAEAIADTRYRVFDGDNHYYETYDCFTRHIDPAWADWAI